MAKKNNKFRRKIKRANHGSRPHAGRKKVFIKGAGRKG